MLSATLPKLVVPSVLLFTLSGCLRPASEGKPGNKVAVMDSAITCGEEHDDMTDDEVELDRRRLRLHQVSFDAGEEVLLPLLTYAARTYLVKITVDVNLMSFRPQSDQVHVAEMLQVAESRHMTFREFQLFISDSLEARLRRGQHIEWLHVSDNWYLLTSRPRAE